MGRARLLRAAILAAPLALGACALKTPPERDQLARQALPNTKIPASWSAGASSGAALGANRGEALAANRNEAPVAPWLGSFGEPRMTALVAEALAYNADLNAAAARVEQAAAQLKIAGAALSPAVDVLGRANHKVRGGGSTNVTGAILSASWEIDLWGRIRYGQQAAREQHRASAADYEYARQSIAALVAKSWFVAAEAGVERQLAREAVDAAVRTADIARVRARVGTGDERDIALADASVQTYRDTLRQLELAREQALRALEVLVGRYPAATLDAATTLPPLPAPVAAGIPSEVLERRPDVIAAERRVAAAFNRVGEAQAARLPSISLTAGLNWINSSRFVLRDTSNPGASVGGLLLWPFLQGGALEGQVEARTAEQKRAIAKYAATGLKAFNEVESALAAAAASADREKLLRQAVADNERTLKLSQVQFRVGRIDQRAMITDQLQLYATRVQLVRVQSEALAQRVNLHLALGGAIAEATAAPPAAAAPVQSGANPRDLGLQTTENAAAPMGSGRQRDER